MTRFALVTGGSSGIGLLEFIRQTDVLGTVILEDNANAINRLLRNHAECNREFNNRAAFFTHNNSNLSKKLYSSIMPYFALKSK